MAGNFNVAPVDFSGLANGLLAYGAGVKKEQDQQKLVNALQSAQLPGGGYDWNKLVAGIAPVDPQAALTYAAATQKARMPDWRVNPINGQYYDNNSISNPGELQTASGASEPSISPAQKTEDQTFAKTVPEWESGGQAEETQSLSALDEAINNLKSNGGQGVSGVVPGMFGTIGKYVPGVGTATMGELIKKYPDYAAANYPKAVSTMNSHVRAVAGGMKAILGGQRSQAIVQQIIGATYNADLPPAENLARLQRLRANIETAGKAKSAQVAYFKQHGTLAGYSGPDPEALVGGAVNDFNAGSQQPSPAEPPLNAPPVPGAMQPIQADPNGPLFPSQKPPSNINAKELQLLQWGRDAIAQGADPKAVQERLIQLGVNPQ